MLANNKMKEFQNKREQENQARKLGAVQKQQLIQETSKVKEMKFEQRTRSIQDQMVKAETRLKE